MTTTAENPVTEPTTSAQTPEAKSEARRVRKGFSRRTSGRTKTKSAKRSSAGSSSADSARKKKPAKRGARGAKPHTAASTRMADQGRYVLVINMTKDLQRKLDKARAKTGDSRSSFARNLVERKLGK